MEIDDSDSDQSMWPSRYETPFVETDSFRGAWAAKRTDERLYRMIRGFHEAGDLLVAEGADDSHRAQNLLYPVIFNYRQSLELQLKYLLMVYGPLVGEKPDFQSHGLSGLWAKCKRVILRLEGRLEPSDPEAFQAVDSQIAEFDAADPGSYSFRFAHNPNGRAMNLAISEIDLPNLRKVMDSLHNFLECIDWHLHYGCGVPRCEH
ncbi:MAG: hypothetical protein WD073_00665 [Xanthobacteraceae bacterium]